MGGQPVWLASISKTSSSGRVVSALKLSPRLLREALALLNSALRGVGDIERERGFSMCITTCLHRALSPEEVGALPEDWHTTPALDIAGGPVRVLYSRGIPPILSVEPCEDFEKQEIGQLDSTNEPLWIPIECGGCPPCLARAAAVETELICQ